MNYFIETFGCQMNVADSLEMARHLERRGFSRVAAVGEADCVLVNTCTVRDHAEHKALSYLGRLAEWPAPRGQRLLVVAGCAAERWGDKLRKRFPHVSMVVGAKSIGAFDQLLENRYPHLSFDGAVENHDAWGLYASDTLSEPTTDGVTAFVSIMRGCNFSCSYCIVPSVRGRELYRPALSVLKDVRRRVTRGQREIMLLGQTVNSYRPSDDNLDDQGRPVRDFADLLRSVGQTPGLARLRFMSPHPFFLTDRMIDAMAETPTVCPHLHLPVQSGSRKILEKMRRNYTPDQFLERVYRLRQKMPSLSLTTDFIVGYPDETENDFQDTLALARAASFDGAFCFKYSPRPGTLSAQGADTVSRDEKENRLARLLELTESLSEAKAQERVGTLDEILIERQWGPGLYDGRSRGHRSAMVEGPEGLTVGDLLPFIIESVDGKKWRGRAKMSSEVLA